MCLNGWKCGISIGPIFRNYLQTNHTVMDSLEFLCIKRHTLVMIGANWIKCNLLVVIEANCMKPLIGDDRSESKRGRCPVWSHWFIWVLYKAVKRADLWRVDYFPLYILANKKRILHKTRQNTVASKTKQHEGNTIIYHTGYSQTLTVAVQKKNTHPHTALYVR